MRLLNLYQVRDQRAGEVVGNILASYTEVGPARQLEQLALDEQSLIGRYPDEYALYLIGMQDVETGRLDGLEHPELVCTARQLLKPKTA